MFTWRMLKFFIIDHWRGLLVIALVAAVAFFIWKRIHDADAEVKREREAAAQAGQQRIDEAKSEDNRAAENVNAARSANYSNLSNDELRERLINAARRQK